MFSNPLGSVFNNKPEGEEKKKKRNRKTKKLSPELSEESLGSKNDLSGAQEPQTSASPIQQLAEAGNTLLDIVSEINNPQAVAAPEEPVVETAPVEEPVVETAPVEEPAAEEQVETQYEELPVEESTMKTIIDSIHSFNSSNQVPSEEAWESEVAAAPQSVDSVWETMLSAPEQPAETEPVFKLAAPAVESCWEDFLSTPEPSAEEESAVPEPSTEESVVVDEQKNRVLEQFNISETSYELVKDFFNEQQSEQLLKNELLRYLLNQALANRAELQGVSEEDVNRALKAIDSNQDDKVNFDEFVQLLTLFFSSKNNLQQRIAELEAISAQC